MAGQGARGDWARLVFARLSGVLSLLRGRLGRRAPERIRTTLLALALILSAAKFLHVVDAHYAIREWLFWHYARVGALSGTWALVCVFCGHAVLKLLWRRTLPILEHVVLSFAIGILLFSLAMFVAGIAGAYGPAFGLALPPVMLAAGARPALRYFRRMARHLRHARGKPRMAPPIWLLPITIYGALSIGMIYFLILTPENVAYDSRWYHLAIGEHYAAQGAVRASPEGWMAVAIPHLATFLYAWAFLLPGLEYFDRIELAAHIEFVIFLFTLASIPVLVRALLPRTRAHLAWTATFLFPGIFLYDSSLGVAADHIAAFWAVPIYITMRRALDRLEPKRCAIFAAMISGAALTKYQTASLIAWPLAALAIRTAQLGIRCLRQPRGPYRSFWQGPTTAAALGVLLTAPHWLKNWLFYGSPFYPHMYRHFHVHPWTVDSPLRVRMVFATQAWQPQGTFREKLSQTLLDGVLNFSFRPHDWAFHGDVPVFGSLFTLLVVPLLFLKKSGRVALLFLGGHVGVFVWYWLSHQDRYLQILVPWMASAVAATLVLIWRSGIVGRIASIPLLAAQIIWGGDVYFYPTHNMMRQSPIKTVTDLMSWHYRKDRRPFAPYGAWFDIGNTLPKRSKVLVHQYHIHLGLRAMTVSDWEIWQTGLSYGRLANARAVYDLLKGYGVTHLVSGINRQSDSLAGDLLFWQFAKLYAVEPQSFGEGLTLAKMPPAPPVGPFSDTVLVRACGSAEPYRDGAYALSDLTVVPDSGEQPVIPSPKKPWDSSMSTLQPESDVARAQFVVLNPSCDSTLPSALPIFFRQIATRGDLQLWARAGPL